MRICSVVLLAGLLASCSTSVVEPNDTDPIPVGNVAEYDGTAWHVPQFSVRNKSSQTAVVNAMVASPHDINTLIVAGAFDQAINDNTVTAAGIALFNTSGTVRALVEGGDDKPFYRGGPYTTAEFHPAGTQMFFAGSIGEVSNSDVGVIGPAGR
ncbi:MAG: hypothetical protein H7X80_05655, partial [bacterium]|nr:hypothetical protein [Candidatus Kapabacteria bacterium]